MELGFHFFVLLFFPRLCVLVAVHLIQDASPVTGI